MLRALADRHRELTDLDDRVTLVPISVAKGLEIDAVVVVEPARIVASEAQGLRALYVALTRPTQRLTVVHAGPLPSAMTDPEPPIRTSPSIQEFS